MGVWGETRLGEDKVDVEPPPKRMMIHFGPQSKVGKTSFGRRINNLCRILA